MYDVSVKRVCSCTQWVCSFDTQDTDPDMPSSAHCKPPPASFVCQSTSVSVWRNGGGWTFLLVYSRRILTVLRASHLCSTDLAHPVSKLVLIHCDRYIF